MTDDAGIPVPGSIAELTTVSLGGVEQTISVRAADPDKPVLLYLSGGPGQSDIAFARALLEPLTRDFVVVDLGPAGQRHVVPGARARRDLHPRPGRQRHRRAGRAPAERFDEQKVYLLGESWGTTLGVLAVERRPDLFHAYIGSGQMVSQRVTDQIDLARSPRDDEGIGGLGAV